MERRPYVLASLMLACSGTLTAGVAISATADPHVAAGTVPVDDEPLFVYARGVLTPADGSFEVAFSATPSYVVDANGIPSLIAWSGTNSEAVMFFPADALADDGARATDRATRFVQSSGTEVAWLANTPTRLGPYPAAYFIARLVLNDDTPAVVHGVAVVGDGEVTVAVFTDRGGGGTDDGDGVDDGDADPPGEQARTFVESYTVVFDDPPAPGGSAADATADDADDADAAADTADNAVTTSFDGAWSVAFPDDGSTLRASSEEGFTFAEYHARAGDGDHAYVRVTELPPGYTGEPFDLLTSLPASNLVAPDALVGVGDGPGDADTAATLAAYDAGGRPATLVTYRPDRARARTVTVLTVVDAPADDPVIAPGATRLITVAYIDVDGDSQDDADDFIASFAFATTA